MIYDLDNACVRLSCFLFPQHRNAQYVWNKEQFNALNVNTTDCLMGNVILF